MIRVKPARRLRGDFARYVARQGGGRMLTESEFGLPADVYTHMPERLLIGALVEGHLYVPVADEPADDSEPTTHAPADEPADEADIEPDDPAFADYGYAHGNLDAPIAEDNEDEGGAAPPRNGVDCPRCGRHMINKKGLKTHMTRAHGNDTEDGA